MNHSFLITSKYELKCTIIFTMNKLVLGHLMKVFQLLRIYNVESDGTLVVNGE